MSLYDICVFVGSLAFVMGLLLLFSPASLKKINDISARMISKIDSLTFTYRIGYGVSLLIVSAFMFFMAYYALKRYH